MKLILVTMLMILACVTFGLLKGKGSFSELHSLEKEIALAHQVRESLKVRNQTLEAELQDLKHQLGALEERARTDLGMMRKNESFYQFSPQFSPQFSTVDE